MLHNLNQAYTPIERPLAFGPHYNPASLATRKTNCQFDIDFGQGQFPFSLTRTTTATYIDRDSLIQIAASGVPRFTHDFITKQPLGILIEEERTNKTVRSEEFHTGSWTKLGTTSVSPDTDVAPDGNTTADKVTISGSGLAVRQGQVFTAGTDRALSVYVKAPISGAATHCRLTCNDTAAWSTGGSTKIALTDQWQRVELLVSAMAGTGLYFFVGAYAITGVSDPDCYGDVLVWGAQSEDVVDFVSSYIPTASAVVIRRADNVSLAVSSLPFLVDGFSFYIEAVTALVADTALNTGLFSIDDLTSTEQMSILLVTNTSNLRYLCMDGGVAQADNTVASLGFATFIKVAGRFFLNDFAYTVNGGASYTDGAGALPTPTSINLGNLQQNLSSMWDAPVGRFLLYDYAVADAILEAIADN